MAVKEGRALWVESQQDGILRGGYGPEDVKQIIDNAKDLGVNMLLWLVKARMADTAPALWYPSEIGLSHEACYDYDSFGDAVKMAHDSGIEVHAYFSVFTEGDIEAETVRGKKAPLVEHPEWAVVDRQGHRSEFVCASHVGYREYLGSILREIMDKYSVDGISIDFIRYPRSPCFCENCKENLKKKFGLTVDQIVDLLAGKGFSLLDPEHLSAALDRAGAVINYYNQNVHEAVEYFHTIVKSYSQDIKLSAGVFPNPRTAPSQVYCDWVGFTEFLDFVCPMVYWYSPDYYRQVIARLQASIREGTKLYPGISALGVPHALAGENINYLTKAPDMAYVARLVDIARDVGVPGIAIFQYGTIFGLEPGAYTGRKWGTPVAGDIQMLYERFTEPAIPAHAD
ncbi:MAG: family 10 glycosylhydrolase [Firmicutes bacterium]|nr:family 10 glycosylhydrolase [Bacillota bacterium]